MKNKVEFVIDERYEACYKIELYLNCHDLQEMMHHRLADQTSVVIGKIVLDEIEQFKEDMKNKMIRDLKSISS